MQTQVILVPNSLEQRGAPLIPNELLQNESRDREKGAYCINVKSYLKISERVFATTRYCYLEAVSFPFSGNNTSGILCNFVLFNSKHTTATGTNWR